MRHSLQSAIEFEPSSAAAEPRPVHPAAALEQHQHFTRGFHADAEPALTHQQKIREALLLIFADPIPKECLRLWLLTEREWQQALHWLDVNGLALYFLGRLEEANLSSLLPAEVLARLSKNLADNKARNAALLDEAAAIHQSFQSAGLLYATLKGFSLGPLSVPRLELRSQLDFDFLVAESSAAEACRLLEARGYTLRSRHGRSLELGAHDEMPMTLRDLYRPTPHRWVELHIEPDASPVLARSEMLHMHGVFAPALNSVDLFLGQGLHIYKHLRGEATRPSHLLEFRRHVLARSGDLLFWRELRVRAEADPRHPVGLGVVILVIEYLIGPFAPQALTRWTVDRLPRAVRIWAETCAHDAILASSPGTKLNLLLLEALTSSSVSPAASLRLAYTPTQLPRVIAASRPGETLASRLRANVQQLRYNLRRARYYFVQGTRYLYHARRYRKALARSTS